MPQVWKSKPDMARADRALELRPLFHAVPRCGWMARSPMSGLPQMRLALGAVGEAMGLQELHVRSRAAGGFSRRCRTETGWRTQTGGRMMPPQAKSILAVEENAEATLWEVCPMVTPVPLSLQPRQRVSFLREDDMSRRRGQRK